MRISIVYNVAREVITGVPDDLASDREMEIIPDLVREVLSDRGHEVALVEADWNLVGRLQTIPPQVILNLAEGFAGTNGHEHLVPAILDFERVSYTGADAANMLLVRNKVVTKQIMASYGVRTPNYQVFGGADTCDARDLHFPIIVKPVSEEASIGVRLSSVVHTGAQLKERVRDLLHVYAQPVLAEEFIVGRELSVGVWGNHMLQTLPTCEFTFAAADPLEHFRSFEYKWLGGPEAMGRAENIPTDTLDDAGRITCLAHRVLGCRDYSRADFRLSPANELYFLEHNFNPGIGPNTHGLSNTFTRMAELDGIPHAEMLERILRFAVDRRDIR
jgi:D-alanine-D-alanine ligase